MSFRPSHIIQPSRIIRPSAKLHTDNVGQLEVTSHRHAVASAQVAQRGSDSPLLSSPSLPPTELLDDPTSDDAPAPAPTPDSATALSLKRPLVSRNSSLSVLSLSTSLSDPSLDDSDCADVTTNSKRPKTNAHDGTIPIDVQIIDIDGVEDPRDERLNKIAPTADLKEFFTTLARVLHQPKVRVRCNLCA